MTFVIRPATLDDAELVANLLHLSMGELAEYLFGGVRLPVDEILAGLYAMKKNRFSWDAAVIAELDGEPSGLLLSFPGWEFNRRELAIGMGLLKLCGLFDVLRLSPRALSIANGIETHRDEYYLANMGVLPAFQRQDIGSRLLAHAEGRARQSGLRKCSLIVDMQNPGACRLYERVGFEVVFTKTYSGAAENAHAGYHQMVKAVT